MARRESASIQPPPAQTYLTQEQCLDDIQTQREQLKKHFREEFKLKTQIKNFESEIENQFFSLQNKKSELGLVIKDKGASNIQVKIINEEIDEVNQKIGSIKSKLADEQARFNDLEGKRERFKRSWANDKSLTEMHIEVLNLMMNESVQMVENINSEAKFTKAEVRLKLKDAQISKLLEQIQLRDHLILEAKQMVSR